MITPTSVQNARRRLIASIRFAGDRYGMTLFNGFVLQVSTHLLGEVGRWRIGAGIPEEAPDGRDGRPPYLGPLAQLALYWARRCEGWGYLDVGQMPDEANIPTSMLNPLLAHIPTEFNDDLFHEFTTITHVGSGSICLVCNEMQPGHYAKLMELHIAEIEILRSDVEIMEAVLDIQTQAITKQEEAIIALQQYRDNNEFGKLKVMVEPADCRHNNMEGGTTCVDCGVDLGEMPPTKN